MRMDHLLFSSASPLVNLETPPKKISSGIIFGVGRLDRLDPVCLAASLPCMHLQAPQSKPPKAQTAFFPLPCKTLSIPGRIAVPVSLLSFRILRETITPNPGAYIHASPPPSSQAPGFMNRTSDSPLPGRLIHLRAVTLVFFLGGLEDGNMYHCRVHTSGRLWAAPLCHATGAC